MAGRKYSKNYAKFQVSGYATRGGTRFGANEKTYLKKYFFGYVFRSRYVFFLPTKVLLGSPCFFFSVPDFFIISWGKIAYDKYIYSYIYPPLQRISFGKKSSSQENIDSYVELCVNFFADK